MATTDAYGLPINFEIAGGEIYDCATASDLIEKLPASEAVVADKGYDSEPIRQQIEGRGSRAVMLRRERSLKGNGDMDWGLYKYRYLVENAFARLKHYRAVATRYELK